MSYMFYLFAMHKLNIGKVWPYHTVGSMIPCIHMLFQPIFAAFFINLPTTVL